MCKKPELQMSHRLPEILHTNLVFCISTHMQLMFVALQEVEVAVPF